MPWMNLAKVMALLRRRGIDPRSITVYLDETDPRLRPAPPQYDEREMDPQEHESECDEDED